MATLLAVYGTLRRGGRLHHHLRTEAGHASFVGIGTIDGVLYEVADGARDEALGDFSYPCIRIDEPGAVVVELFDVHEPTLLDHLDEIEGYDPDDPAGSEYHRRLVPVRDVAIGAGPVHAWVYVYLRAALDPARRLPHGDWSAHRPDR